MLQDAISQAAAIRPPKPFFWSLETRDADVHGRSIGGWCSSYEQVGRQAFSGQITELRLWPIQLIAERIDHPCVWRGSAWSGARVFVSIVESSGNVSCGGRAVTPSAVSVLPRDLADHSFNSAPLCTLTVAVSETALVEHAERIFKRPIPAEALARGLAVTDAEVVEAYQHCVASILREIEERPDALEEAEFRADVRKRVLGTLVDVLAAGSRTAEPMSPPTTRSYVVEKAIRYMDSHIADPLEMADLCEAIRVCPRTLRYSFQEVVGVSPTEYLLAMRLTRVRRALQAAGPASNVQCVAARFGFSHMGRFARFYGDTFGECPSVTLRRGAQAASAARRR